MRIVSTMDCGCAIDENGRLYQCPTCAQGPLLSCTPCSKCEQFSAQSDEYKRLFEQEQRAHTLTRQQLSDKTLECEKLNKLLFHDPQYHALMVQLEQAMEALNEILDKLETETDAPYYVLQSAIHEDIVAKWRAAGKGGGE